MLVRPMSKYLIGSRLKDRRRARVRRNGEYSERTRNAFVMAIIAVGVLVLVVSSRWTRSSNVAEPGEGDERAIALPSSASERIALDYIEAIQNEDFERVFKMTQWMQERVKHVLLENNSETAQREIEAFYRRERDDFFAASIGTSLTEEGIADPDLFTPNAIVRVVEVKEGLSRPILDKGRPVNMVVLEVEYPPFVTAPTAADEKRIDRVRAALYLTLDGKIIKASVRGNARVYPDAVLYRHLTPSEARRARARTSSSRML